MENEELQEAPSQAVATLSTAERTGNQCAPHDSCMPLVGCSCGAVGGLRYVLNSLTRKYYESMSTCTVCQRYQCLHCGDEFRTRGLCQKHILGTKSHKANTAIVTTEHSNRPLSTKTSAPQLNDNIELVPCGGQCPGTEGDAFKVHQYMTKCRICQHYKCAICMKNSKPRSTLEIHITDTHGFDCHLDIVETAILQHKNAAASSQRAAVKPHLEDISFVPAGAKPLVGCSCGAPGGPEYYKNLYTIKYHNNMSRCKVCMRFQCLMCGDEFGISTTCQTHISDEKTHQDGTAVVTTEHPNRPLPAPYSPAPPLSDQIKLLPCIDRCSGTINDTFKIHQYMSKCRTCGRYKCALCIYKSATRNRTDKHISKHHQVNFLEPVMQQAIEENQNISVNNILLKKLEDASKKPLKEVNEERKPLVGCSCGAPNGPTYLFNTTGNKHHKNISFCRVCRRYQCLHCGDEFLAINSCVHHALREKSHQDGTVCVTTEHPNRPLPPPLSLAPPLSDQIVPLPCVDDCSGKSNDAFKVNQYMSKCRLCEQYKCSICTYRSKHKGLMTKHLAQTHKVDYMKPVEDSAIKKHMIEVKKIQDFMKDRGGTVRVTIEILKCPLLVQAPLAPPLSEQIESLTCGDDCPGTAIETLNVNQHVSKCRLCERYKCLICRYRVKYEGLMTRHFIQTHSVDSMKPVQDPAIKKPAIEKTTNEQMKPLVGCSCGAANGPSHLTSTVSKKLYKNVSFCGVCKRYQCLDCGDEFPTLVKCVRHALNGPSHRDGTVSVTTEHPNRPLSPPFSVAPTLSDQIAPLPCVDDCPGKSNDAFKVNQYTSKCRLCERYKCSICTYKAKYKSEVTRHLTKKHKLDYMKPVDDSAIKENTEIRIPSFK